MLYNYADVVKALSLGKSSGGSTGRDFESWRQDKEHVKCDVEIPQEVIDSAREACGVDDSIAMWWGWQEKNVRGYLTEKWSELPKEERKEIIESKEPWDVAREVVEFLLKEKQGEEEDSRRMWI